MSKDFVEYPVFMEDCGDHVSLSRAKDGFMNVRMTHQQFSRLSSWFGKEMKRKNKVLVSSCVLDAAHDLLEALECALEWIDAVPRETVLPAMPGFDRDWVDEIVAKAKGEQQ